jgi:Fic family protein
MTIPGEYILSAEKRKTFVPNVLPPKLPRSEKLNQRVEEATHLLGQVKMCRTLLPNADLLIYSSLQREAIASSTIEGTIASPSELVLFQFSHHSERAAVREVANYRTALEWGYEQLNDSAITERVILGLHERLLDGVRGDNTAGRFKVRQNAIGGPTDTLDTAVFIPAPPEKTRDLIYDLLRFVNSVDSQHPKVIQCALAHYQFETIHPFSDGNGRVGRLLIILHLIQLGLLNAPLIYPSVYFEKRRPQYYATLQAVRDSGKWNDWLLFFVEGVVDRCQETIQFTETILALKHELHQKVAGVNQRAAVAALLDAFFEQPVLSMTELHKRAHMAYNTADKALETMINEGLAKEITGKLKGRLYVCPPVFNAIFVPAPSP